jgi:hypothetical protein
MPSIIFLQIPTMGKERPYVYFVTGWSVKTYLFSVWFSGAGIIRCYTSKNLFSAFIDQFWLTKCIDFYNIPKPIIPYQSTPAYPSRRFSGPKPDDLWIEGRLITAKADIQGKNRPR